MTHGCRKAICETSRPPPMLSPNLQQHTKQFNTFVTQTNSAVPRSLELFLSVLRYVIVFNCHSLVSKVFLGLGMLASIIVVLLSSIISNVSSLAFWKSYLLRKSLLTSTFSLQNQADQRVRRETSSTTSCAVIVLPFTFYFTLKKLQICAIKSLLLLLLLLLDNRDVIPVVLQERNKFSGIRASMPSNVSWITCHEETVLQLRLQRVEELTNLPNCQETVAGNEYMRLLTNILYITCYMVQIKISQQESATILSNVDLFF